MDRKHPGVTFARYLDDVVGHATTVGQAERLRSAIAMRMAEVGLMLHPVKTKIVYYKDDNRSGAYEHARSRSWGSRFAPAAPGTSTGSSLPRSCPRCRGRHSKRWVNGYAGGRYT